MTDAFSRSSEVSVTDDYAEWILPHAESKRFRGVPESKYEIATRRNATCGDQVRLMSVIDQPSGRIISISCDPSGCIISRAAASILCEHLFGQSMAFARLLTARKMLDLMRVPLLPRRRQCALLAWQAWQELQQQNEQSSSPSQEPFVERQAIRNNNSAVEMTVATRVALTSPPAAKAGTRHPIVHVYSICWNEERMLPYFLRHYERIADRIILYDNESDDLSREIAAAHPLVDLRTISSGSELREACLLQVKGKLWKESRGAADWVIACDIDELLWCSDFPAFLAECRTRGVTVPQPTGIQLIADSFPTTSGQVYDEVRRGFVEPNYSKCVLFDPNAIQEMNYVPGCHVAYPTGRVLRESVGDLRLLHAKFLGEDYCAARYREIALRHNADDRRAGFSLHYHCSREQLAAAFADYRSRAVPLNFLSETGVN